MSAHTRKHFTAWLGLVAMWLIVLAPLVSQSVAAAHRDNPAEDVLCSAIQQPASALLQNRHYKHDAAGLDQACGYCDLLINHAVMPPAPAVPFLFFAVTAPSAVAPLLSRFVPFGAFASGRPRAPPV
ncbi:DUF2946 domain-containing protein [Paraburkholderia sp. J12]|uniref:DUF2946 domain-containing protein n=1 Tax=Paraburkholderia sp. J12 TaxID=2805432 RepID=UPI002ABE4507|nr:DUF2946 domain-containing protein [Paraburkholderia sp. J12]